MSGPADGGAGDDQGGNPSSTPEAEVLARRPRRKMLSAVRRVVGRRSARGGGATCLRRVDGPGRVDRVQVVPGAPSIAANSCTCRRSGKRRGVGSGGATGRRAGARGDARGRIRHRMRGARERPRRARTATPRIIAPLAGTRVLRRGSTADFRDVCCMLGVGGDARSSNVGEGSRVARQGRGRSDTCC